MIFACFRRFSHCIDDRPAGKAMLRQDAMLHNDGKRRGACENGKLQQNGSGMRNGQAGQRLFGRKKLS